MSRGEKILRMVTPSVNLCASTNIKDYKFQSNDEKEEVITKKCSEQEKYYDVSNNFSDDSIGDPDFLPSDEFESNESEQGETQKKLNVADFGNAVLYESSNCRGEEKKKNLSTEMNCTQTQTVLKGKTKQDFCVFCKKLVTKIHRHLETVHKNEPEVKEFACLPKGNDERKQLIAILRKKGNFFFNTNEDFNNKQIITCRRSQKGKERNPDHYLPCPNCKGFFSKLTLRRHVRICGMEEKGERNILMRSRRIHGCVHKKAGDILKNEVFPILRDDEVTKVVRYDELAITYANKLCSKYRSKHHFPMIRSKLRLIGRFLIEIRQLNPQVTDFASVFDPKYFDSVIKAINLVAKLDELTGRYGSPATAFMFGTLLKKCANILLFQCIMQENTIKKRMTKDFLKLLHQDFTYSINSTVQENVLQNKRQKEVVLPNLNDIKRLNNYLNKNRRKYSIDLKENGFTYHSWKNLSHFTLVSILVFNRRRAGELERTLISDFENYKSVDKNTDEDIFKNLSGKAQEATRRYVRFMIRGKLARGVPVLLHKDLLEHIKLILRYRKEAKVPDENPFLFGLPGSTNYKYLRANTYIREYSVACGAANPATLRGTLLRKHIATQSVLLNLQDTEVEDLANFLGHAEKIHKEHYRMPIITRDIAQMSRLLELAQGTDNGEDIINVRTEENSSANTLKKNNDNDINIGVSDDMFTSSESKSASSSSHLASTPIKRRKSLEISSYIKRTTWNTPEKKRARLLFSEHLKEKRLPSFDECVQYVTMYEELKNRTPMQLKLWVNNQIRMVDKLDTYPTSKQKTVRTWRTPEKNIIKKVFSKNLRNLKLPSLTECRDVIETYPVLKNRSPAMVKGYVNNDIVRRKLKMN